MTGVTSSGSRTSDTTLRSTFRATFEPDPDAPPLDVPAPAKAPDPHRAHRLGQLHRCRTAVPVERVSGSMSTRAASSSPSATRPAATRRTVAAATCGTPRRARTSGRTATKSSSTSTTPTTRHACWTRSGRARWLPARTGSPWRSRPASDSPRRRHHERSWRGTSVIASSADARSVRTTRCAQVCNRAGMVAPSASQYHGTVAVAIILAVAGLAFAASLSLRGVGPYEGRARGWCPPSGPGTRSATS